jgi:hypothetical protein
MCFLSISFGIIRSKKEEHIMTKFLKLSFMKILEMIEKVYSKEVLNKFFVQ